MQCVGIFGGTFDPIHYGHLRTALELLLRLGLSSVRFVPCGTPPHRDRPLLNAALRLQMVKAAIASERRFIADAREIDRGGYSYTFDTLAELRREYPQTPMGLIVGMDAFIGLPSWHRWDEILSLAHIIVARRPGWQLPEQGRIAELIRECAATDSRDLSKSLFGRIYIASVTQLEISSTDLRDSIAAGIDPMYLVPPSVRAIIIETESYAKKRREDGLDA